MVTGDHLLTGLDVWPRLAELVTGAGRVGRSPAYLAIACIGSTADQWLPLRPGDILVCGATDASVRLGLTSTAVLRRWHDSGAHVFSRPGLHAKSGVVGARAFIGSANASRRSVENRDEATLVTTDRRLVAELRTFVGELLRPPALELGVLELDRLAALPVRAPKWPEQPARPPLFPAAGRILLFDGVDARPAQAGRPGQPAAVPARPVAAAGTPAPDGHHAGAA